MGRVLGFRMVHQDYKEMIPARVLSALDAADARALNDHLADCEECRTELQDWEATAAAMAVSANPMEPSPKVRERILDEIRNESKSEVIPFRSATRNIWTSFGSLGAIAAVILVTALIVGLVVLWRQNDATNRALAHAREFMELATTPGAKVMRLDGIDLGAGATAKLAYDKNGRAMLMADKLPNVPEGKGYQLWFIVGKNPPMPGKTFTPDETGKGMLRDQMPATAIDSAVFAITMEPVGGSDAPTSPIYLRSSAIN
jgi:anti-sigma-K factor RskA